MPVAPWRSCGLEDVGRWEAGEVRGRQHVVGSMNQERHEAYLGLLRGEVFGSEADGQEGRGVLAPVGEMEGDVQRLIGELKCSGDGRLEVFLRDALGRLGGVAEAFGEELADLRAKVV